MKVLKESERKWSKENNDMSSSNATTITAIIIFLW